MRTLFQFNTF